MEFTSRIKPAIIFSTLAGILILSGCKKEQIDPLKIEASNLYAKSLVLIRNYTDSIGKCNDSVEVNRLTEKFDSQFTALNYDFPPDTDLRMTEESNDSIKKMLLHLVETRKKKLKNLAGLDVDSIARVDSLLLRDSITAPNAGSRSIKPMTPNEGSRSIQPSNAKPTNPKPKAIPKDSSQSASTSISQSAQLK